MRNKMEKGRGSVRLKFWQKTYLLTLALFLLALGGGTTAIASVSQQRAFEAECGKLLAQQHSVAQSLAADAAAVQARRPEALPRLAQNYAGQLKRSGVFLRVAQAGDVWADELPEPDSALPEVPPEGQRVHTVLLSGGRHVLYISAVLPAPPEDVAVTCAFDMEAFFVQWAQTRRAFLLAGAAVSAVLAAALYVVLRGLSRPMERLARVAGRLADGDYTARSPERTRDEVGQLAHALNEMAARVEWNVAELRETARRKQQLVDNVAHELRTPLTAVGGYAEYIQRAELSEEEKYEAAQYIVEEANRLAVMSERLLQMAALRGEQAAREPVDVPALLEKAARTVAPKADARGGAADDAGAQGQEGDERKPAATRRQRGQQRSGLKQASLQRRRHGPPDAHGAGYGPRHGRGDAGAHRRTVLQAGQGPQPGTGRRGAGPCAVLPDRAEPWRGAVLYLRAGRGHHGRRNIYSLMTS